MSFSIERLKAAPVSTKLLINGYMRECQQSLFGAVSKQNPYYSIPQLVNNHCILFYELFTWYHKKHGDGIEFISDTKIFLHLVF